MNPTFPLMMPIITNPQNIDMTQMQQFMPNNQFMMPMPMNMGNDSGEMQQNQTNDKTA